PLPDADARRKLIQAFARNLRLEWDDWRTLLDATDGVTPAMLKEIVKRAAVSAIERDGKQDGQPQVVVREADLLLAAEQVRAGRDPEIVPGSFGFREKVR